MISFKFCNNINIWKIRLNTSNNIKWDYKILNNYHVTYCLSPFTYRFRRYQELNPNQNIKISGTLYLRFYPDYNTAERYYNYNIRSNILLISIEEYKKYLNLCKRIIDFNYKFDTRNYKSNNIQDTWCIRVDFKDCTYTMFMLILTLVRYGYEFPASHYLRDVLQLYQFLDGKENIINCIHTVFATYKVTHNHETQTIYKYHSMLFPLFISVKNIQNNYKSAKCLLDLFTSCNTMFPREPYNIGWEPESFNSNFKDRLKSYIQTYNLCKLKSM